MRCSVVGDVISEPMMLEQYVAIADYKKKQKNEVNLNAGISVEVVEKNENGGLLLSTDNCHASPWVTPRPLCASFCYSCVLYLSAFSLKDVRSPLQQVFHVECFSLAVAYLEQFLGSLHCIPSLLPAWCARGSSCHVCDSACLEYC